MADVCLFKTFGNYTVVSVVRQHKLFFCDIIQREIGLVGKGMGVSPMSARVSTSSATVLDRFHATETTVTLRFAKLRKTATVQLPSKHFLRAADHLNFFDPLTTTQVNII